MVKIFRRPINFLEGDRRQKRSLYILLASLVGFSLAVISLQLAKADIKTYEILLIAATIVLPERIVDVLMAPGEDAEEDEHRLLINNLHAAILESHDITFFRSRRAALAYCIEKMKGAESVKNMVLRYGNNATHAASDRSYAKWFEAKQAALERGCELTEIVSQHLAENDMQRKYMSAFKVAKFDYASKSIDDAKQSWPQVTILNLGGGEKEAIFGWEFPGRRKGSVFGTANPTFIEFWERYFDKLYEELNSGRAFE